MKNKRREFLKTAGSSALFASLGSSFFISCSDENDDLYEIPTSDLLLKMMIYFQLLQMHLQKLDMLKMEIFI